LFLLNLKQDLGFSVLPVTYVHVLYVWLAHFVYMLKAIEKSQESREILRRHEAHGRFLLLHTVAILQLKSGGGHFGAKEKAGNNINVYPAWLFSAILKINLL